MKRCTQQKTKTQSKVIGSLEQNKLSSIWYSTAPKSQFAALIPENIKLVYLRRSLVMELIKQPESIKTKIIGSFVLVKLDPQRNSHQLVQITGVFSGTKLGSSDTCNSESSIQVSNVATDVSLTMLSDKDILEEHCDVLRKNVKAGLQKKLTIVELQQRAKILHEDITKHRIARELKVLQGKIDQANEKGWRQELTEHLNRRYLLQQDSYLSSVLENIPRVTPEEIEPVSLDGNDNQIVTTIKKNITGVTPEKIDSEPLAENNDGKLSSDNGDFSGEGPPKKGDEKKTYTQQKTKMQRRDTSQKKEFVGWGSKSLIDFLQFIGHDTREKLSPYDVTSMVIKYANENDLIHPIEKRKILCDIQLEALLGGKVVNRDIILSLLKSHFVENEERLQKNELAHDLEDNDTEMFVASKTEKKVEQNKRSSIWYSTAAQSQFAALIPENIKLVYLKRSLVLEMIKKPESFETKIIGSFVRVKLDSRDFELRNSHQLVQITGIQPVSSDNCCCKSSIQVSNIAKNVCLNTLSDDEFSNEECDEFRKKVKDGIFKKLTVVELEQRAKILHEDITNHRIARELELALQNIPKVIPEEVESLDGDDNQMHLCSDEATLQKKIILE
ncbi:zinc finger CCCH domain-containing protein 19-like isoform X2 [Solanum lycopersicum]|uniref:zinc finger CCCH domain-containing protein 19-like isoform X2 n=1 Tax=Solanum lycopersicum TaxID=4081 RepID=UPI000532BFB1